MTGKTEAIHHQTNKRPSLMGLLKPYKGFIILLILMTFLANGLNLAIPKMVANAIDTYSKGELMLRVTAINIGLIAVGIFVFTYLQSILQTYAAERVARDLRKELAAKISNQDYVYIQNTNPAMLLTNLTSDVDAVKLFVSQAIAAIASSVFIIVGAGILMILTHWKLGVAVLITIPVIGLSFVVIFRKIRVLFQRSQEAIDWLNKVISESILGAALIRVLNSQNYEYDKFLEANTEAKNIGLSILRLFASMIPVSTFIINLATVIIVVWGGHLVIIKNMSLGDFTAFNSYLAMLFLPILIINFMGNVIAQAGTSYQRVLNVINAPERTKTGDLSRQLNGHIEVRHISLQIGEKRILNDVSFSVRPRSKTAIIGPTAAGKTQLLYLMTGLLRPTSGIIKYDEDIIDAYDERSFHEQTGMVFQDSAMFNLTLRENIAFSKTVSDEAIQKAIETSELSGFIHSLPEGLNTVVSERGNSLSGGQKQRVMLARALALNPKILFLDDFTARVDNQTEDAILKNMEANYPDLTLISVTQKINSVRHYDQIILLMEGELLAIGTHEELMATSPEYVQIFNSQQSTSHYELQPE